MHHVRTQPSQVFRRFGAMRSAYALLLMVMTLGVPPVRASAAEVPASPLVFAGSGGNLALTRALVGPLVATGRK